MEIIGGSQGRYGFSENPITTDLQGFHKKGNYPNYPNYYTYFIFVLFAQSR